MEKKYITKNSEETKELGKEFAKEVLKMKKPIVIGLNGELGAGKTSFIQGFALGLGVKEKILSPTFVILKRFKLKKGNFFHIDCYRVNSSEDLKSLGFEEIVKDNIIAIEWPERIKDILPKDTIWINFSTTSENEREIEFKEPCE